jgi:hypothetical protein
MCWLLRRGLKISEIIRDVGILFGDCEYHFVILLFGQVVEKRKQSVFDCVETHQSGYNGNPVNGIDSGGQVVGFELFLEKIESVNIVHFWIFYLYLNQSIYFYRSTYLIY